MKELKRLAFGDMTAIWYDLNGLVAFGLVPTAQLGKVVEHEERIPMSVAVKGMLAVNHGQLPGAISSESCLQLKCPGDSQSGSFATGCSMRNSGTNARMKFTGFTEIPRGIRLTFQDAERGLEAVQELHQGKGEPWIAVNTTLANHGKAPVQIDYLASFSLGLLSLFQADEGSGSYQFLQWHSGWSAEGRLEQQPIEALGLEKAWSGWGFRNVRFGSRTSMPVQGYFPQEGFADTQAGVAWGVSLAAVGPWELEVSRIGDFFNLSGGLPDREFDGWFAVLQPGERLCGPEAALTCAAVPDGDYAAALQNRLAPYAGAQQIPKADADLPLMFNEWCTTWGKPTRANLLPIAQRLQGSGIRHFVMDAGWYGAGWTSKIGDWLPMETNYPDGGLAGFCAELRKLGFNPGIWFEFENVTQSADLFKAHPEWLLRLNGEILTDGNRAFLDFRKPEVIAYLDERVIGLLKKCNIGFMKVDYNAPIGAGCDGPAPSPAENLRLALAENWKFFRHLRQELPELVLEICASGGHRLDAAWMRLGVISSSSDAHEGVEIPLVAANTANLIALRNNEIWAVLHDWDDESRLAYSLAAGFMGRLCLSGDLNKLSDEQWSFVKQALEFDRAIVPVLQAGNNHLYRALSTLSYTHPEGRQLFTRTSADGEQMLVVLHTFAKCTATAEWQVPGNWMLKKRFGVSNIHLTMSLTEDSQNTWLSFAGLKEFQAVALLLESR